MEHDVRELGELDLNKLILVVAEEIKDEELRAMVFSPGVHFVTNVMTVWSQTNSVHLI